MADSSRYLLLTDNAGLARTFMVCDDQRNWQGTVQLRSLRFMNSDHTEGDVFRVERVVDAMYQCYPSVGEPFGISPIADDAAPWTGGEA